MPFMPNDWLYRMYMQNLLNSNPAQEQLAEPMQYQGIKEDESLPMTMARSWLMGQRAQTNAELGEGVGGTAGGLVGSIWGPIGKFVGKKVGQNVGGGIQELFQEKNPWPSLFNRFVLNPAAETIGYAKNPMSILGGK